jgi:hypothetical protein
MANAPAQQRARSFLQNLFALLLVVVVLGIAGYYLLIIRNNAALEPSVPSAYLVQSPAPFPQPIGTNLIIFYDSFDDATIQWTLAPSGQAVYDGGALVLKDNQYEGIASARPHLQVDDFILEFYTRWLSGAFGGDYGVRFRLNSTGDYYAFYIRNDGRYIVGKQLDGNWFEVFSDFSPAIDRDGGVNLLRVEALDNDLRFFVNGQYLVDVTTEWTGAGDLELVAIRPEGTQWMEVAFDSFVVALHPQRLLSPQTTPVTSTNSEP